MTTPDSGRGTTGEDDYIEVCPGVEVPKVISDVPLEHRELRVVATLTYDSALRRYQVSDLRIAQRPGGPGITSAALRRIPLSARLGHTAVRRVRTLMLVDGEFDNFDAPADTWVHGPTPEALAWVARIYVISNLVGWEPRKQVAATGKMPDATASDWIRRARAAGLLGATTAGKAGV